MRSDAWVENATESLATPTARAGKASLGVESATRVCSHSPTLGSAESVLAKVEAAISLVGLEHLGSTLYDSVSQGLRLDNSPTI